jgi:threonine synthase
MRYVSTRGGMQPAAFTDILLEGLAPDGGLTIPERYPRVDRATLGRWRPLGYRELALEILARYVDDIPRASLKAIVDRTYTSEVFGSDEITPVRALEPGLHLLGLSNGPTAAFKDVAMQLLGGLFEYALARRGETLNILGATSGDTGSAAEYAMRGRRGIRVFMLSPQGRMSPFQTAQMYSLDDPNVFNLAVRGVFDDCQDVVKQVSADSAFKARYRIGTVNSINWARLLAQVVYYFKGYFAVTAADDAEVSFAVPTGNFGNVCAGHVARMMGLPIRRLVVATNENDVLDEFFRTGRYGGRGSADVVATSSPSMDISKASNFERFVFDLVGRDPRAVAALWRELDAAGEFSLAGTPHFARVRDFGFVSGRSSHADRLAMIREVDRRYGVVIDPHTADGVKAGLAHRETGVPLVCLETALPVKFDATIREALGRAAPRPRGLTDLESRPQRFDVIDPDAEAVKAYIAQHAGARDSPGTG